jgi:hypothetical protein
MAPSGISEPTKVSEMITLARVRAEAAKAVAEIGRDFKYNLNGGYCFYRIANPGERTGGYSLSHVQWDDPKTETPCLIGRILESLHLNNDHIRSCQTSAFGLFGLGGRYGGIFDAAAVTYMSHLQVRQDKYEYGHTWGECYDSTEAEVERGAIY